MLIRNRSPNLTQAERLKLAEIDVKSAQSKGALPWYPMCAKCRSPVKAYGLSNETSTHYEVWAECGHGMRLRERRVIRLRKPRADMKGHPGSWLKNAIRMMVFFG